jgi:endonuclease-3
VQESFDFVADDIAFVRHALADHFGSLAPFRRRAPIWQLIRSMLGARTYDAIAESALRRLMGRWPHPAGIAEADPAELLRLIETVTYAEDKARHLVATMHWLGRECPDYDLGFLATLPVCEALDWLERFPGVGPKVAAATLNASTLARPVFIVDSHVHRILLRFGFIGPNATAGQGRAAVSAAGLDAEELLDLFVRMKKLGQQVCKASAACTACPLTTRCARTIGLGRPPLGSAFVPFNSSRVAPTVASSPGSRVAERWASHPTTRRT